MKVLILVPRLPSLHPDGLSVVIQAIAPTISESCDIALYALEKSDEAPCGLENEHYAAKWKYYTSRPPASRSYHHLSPIPITLPRLHRGSRDWVNSILDTERPDVALVCGATLGSLIGMMSRKVPCVYAPLDCSSRHHAMLATCSTGRTRVYQMLQAMKWRWYEAQVINHSAATIFVSPMDASSAASRGNRQRLHVIPNGVDAVEFATRDSTNKEYDIVISGNFDYPPNVDGLLHFLKDVRPLSRHLSDGARILVCGKCSDRQLISKMSQFEFVTCFWNVEQMNTFISKARLFVCPVRFGTGIRNNVLQAMACGLPVITYPINVEALSTSLNHGCMVAASERDFALQMDGLLQQTSGELSEQGLRGRAYVIAEHDWRNIGKRYLDVLVHAAIH